MNTGKVRLPWFRVHIVVLNDPGRLISTHLMHTGLISGWAGVMLGYELIIYDRTDPVYNPIWRQGIYAMPFASRIGVVQSSYAWTIGVDNEPTAWTYELVSAYQIILSGLLILSSLWHWSYAELSVFISLRSGLLVLDLNRIFGIHLVLASLLCFGFGVAHLSGIYGPGMWTSDSYGLLGRVRAVRPIYTLIGLLPSSYGVVTSNHIIAGYTGFIVSLWHITTRPSPTLYGLLVMGNLESVLSSSIGAVFFITYVVSGSMWYATVSTPLELLGASRYNWDNSYFALEISMRVKNALPIFLARSWDQMPDKLVLYDYIGCNPAKGGLFRSGGMLKGDGIVQNWIGHTNFEMGTLSLTVRRMPAFFETFPVLLIDQGGTLRSDIPFRRAESLYSIEQSKVVVYITGGVLDGTENSSSSLVKNYARKSQFGETFTFDKRTAGGDGVFRTSPRGWYSFSHVVLATLFFFGHLWHAGRALFRDLWTGVTIESLYQSEYGRNEKLGDTSSKAINYL